jgi:predicted metal-binding protein
VPGQRLHDAVVALHDPGRLEVRAVSCMANCERGCSAAISQPGKWSYLLAHLQPALAADLIAYAGAYADSVNGTVLPSRRAASLRNVILGRLPPAEMAA